MVFRKFKPLKQWGKMDTRIFKNILAARNRRKMPQFLVSSAVQEAGIKIYDPNHPDFFATEVRELPVIPHPAYRVAQLHEHPLYKSIECSLFDGTVAFTDGIDQACSLSKAVKRIGFPETVVNLASKIPLPEYFEDHLHDCIMHGERYDPTLEKLPRFFDPVIFWANYFPYRVHGAPVLTRGKIILDNLFRTAHLMALQHSQLLNLRYDRDEPLSAVLRIDSMKNGQIPFVLRSEPHIIVQSPKPITPWTKAIRLSNIRVPDTAPINPRIDLTSDHIYNDNVVLPRAKENLFIDTVLWCHEQNQKYPWTVEQLAAKAIMVCFGAAVAQATRHSQYNFQNLADQPVVTRAVQLVNGRLDLVVFQLNTLDLAANSPYKNVVWIEPGLQLYKAGKFTENLDAVKDLNIDAFKKFMALLLFYCFTDLFMSAELLLPQHVRFLRRHLITLPASYRSFDSNRAAILYFTLSTLDVLGKLEEEVDAESRRKLIDWIYRLQLKSDSEIMGFCAPPAPNFGFLDTGCSVLGGIKVNPNIQDQGSSCSSKDFYVSQHNLAHHWQRPYMVPHSVGFPQLLTRTLPWVQDCMAMRHRGHWPFETRSNRLKNRNLLEVLEDPDDGSVTLWSVSELSTRKRLLEFRLHRLRDEGFDEWRISSDKNEDQEIHDSERTEIREGNWNSSEEVTGLQIHNPSYNNPKFCRTLDVNTALLELRCYKSTGERCRILARSEKELYLCDPKNNVVLTLFNHPVHSLSFIPYMNDEIIFLDDGGLIWYGEMGSNFIRAKCGYDIESIAGSDHPRLIYAASKDGVHLIDLRVGISHGDLLYTIPEYDDTSRNSYHFQYKGAFEKQNIHNLYSLPDVPQMLLVCTSKKFVLVDERMRGLVCLEMAHSIYHGGHYVTSAPSIRDTDRNGTVYPLYILQHTVYPDVQTFSLYRHANSMMWSSLASIKRLQKPRSAAAFYREQPKYNIRIPHLAERLLFGGGPTRAISFLNTYVDSGKEKSFLFRMMDDGSLWYEEISIQNDQDLSEKILSRGASKVKDIVDSSAFDMRRPDIVRSGRPQKKVSIFDVEFDLGASENRSLDTSAEALQPLDTHPENSYPEPQIVRDVADEQLFSKIVLQGCPKQAYGFRGSLGFSKPSWYETRNFDDGDAVPTKSVTSITKNCFLYDSAHISQTYVALCSLLILGDDLSRVDRKAVLEGICCDQLSDGSFRGQQGTESDMRFVYCAIAICHILNDFSTIDMKSVLKFIQRCVNFDGGIGQAPTLESHGGSTFCAIAALAMAGHLWDESVLTHKQIERLVKWALWKQNEGFHGRANKPDDSCYAFWIGGTLKILDAYMFVHVERLRSFIYSTQDRELGGFGKFSDVVPDALHTCYSISALSLLREPNLRMIYPPLNITKRAAEHLTNINMNRY